MKPRGHLTGSSCEIRLLALLLLSLLGYCSGQIQCTRPYLTVNRADGSVDFDSLPAGAEPVQPIYDPGAIGGWYDLAGRFVDAARPGSLPYDQIRTTLTEIGVQCQAGVSTDCTSEEEFDVQRTLSSFATWWVGLIIVTIIGGLMAFGFCITGMCFCCCRCCGNCGGAKTQRFSDNMDCKTFTFTIILSLFLLVLFAAVVLAFFSNQQTFESVGNAQTTINSVVDNGVRYINDTVDELEQIVCSLAGQQGVAGLVVDEAEDFNTTLQDFVSGLESEVETIYAEINRFSPQYDTLVATLTSLMTTSDALVMSGNTLDASLQSISTSLTMISGSTECTSGSTTIMAACSSLPSADTFQSAADFDQLPDVSNQLTDVSNAIQDIDFDALVADGRATFDDIRDSIDSTVASSIGEGTQQVDTYNQTLFNFVDNITATVRQYTAEAPDQATLCPSSEEGAGFLDNFNNIQLNVGYIRECVINSAFEEIQQYDVYRYAFGVVICSLALVTLLLAILGIAMGMCGFRKNKDPDQRTSLSHCGGVCLLLGVIVTFVFGFVLLILCAVFFFLGSNAQKLCQSIESPQYPLFTEIVDNNTFWGGSLIGQLIPANPDNPNTPELYVSGFLNLCENNTGVYTAANLSLLLPTGSLMEEITSRVNFDEVRRNIDNALSNATSDFNFNSTSFLPENVQESLQEITNSSVDQINITAFRTQIEAGILAFDISAQITMLMMISNQLGMLGTTEAMTLQNGVDGIVSDLVDIRDNQIPSIQAQVDLLESEVDTLAGLIDTTVTSTIALVENIEEIIQNITGQSLPDFLDTTVANALDRTFGYLDQSISYVDAQLASNVGRCQPLWGIYVQLYNTACRDFLEGLNGFWWSLGLCAVLFVPVIVFSVLTSNYYLKKKSENEVEGYASGYDDYPMKSY